MTQLGPGTVIAGKYRLDQKLGGGGMGSIWRGTDLQLDVPVAVKFMLSELVEKGPQRARFEREAKAAAKIRSAHVVHMYEHGVDHGIPYIVMELLEGEDLGQRLKREGQLPLDEAARIVTEICKGLHRAHQREIVHRDLKPGNIFLSAPDDGLIKILDFGIAKVAGVKTLGEEITTTGQLLGSPQYMSPEQARGLPLDGRSDLWSLAVIIYRMLTGRRPFQASEVGDLIVRICTDPVPPPSRFRPGLSPAIDAFFVRAFERAPAERFQTAKELAAAFTAAVRGSAAPVLGAAVSALAGHENSWDQSLSAPPSSSVPTADTDAVAVVPAKRPKALWGVIASAVLLLAGGAAAIVLASSSGRSTAAESSAAAATARDLGVPAVSPSGAPASSSGATAAEPAPTSSSRAGAVASSAASGDAAASNDGALARPAAAPPYRPRPAPTSVRPKPSPAPYSTDELGY